MASFVVLGSGAALPVKGRYNTTIALLEGARTVLLDCAEPCTELLYHQGIDPASVDTVVIAHMHADHCNGFAQLTHWKHLVTRPKPTRLSSLNRDLSWYKDPMRWPPKNQWDSSSRSLRIYVPAGVETSILQYLKDVYMRPEITTEFELRVFPYTSGLVHQDSTLSITAHANSHIWSYYPELDGTDAVRDSYSLMVEVGGKKCLYSSDIGSLSDIEGIVEQADLVFLEGAHPSAEEILAFVKRLGLKRVIIVHILATREQEFASMKSDLSRANVEISHDGFEVEL